MRWRRISAASLLAVSSLCADPLVELSPYLVEAWHFDGLGIEVPAGVLRIESEAIESSGAGSVPELLERLAGVRFRGVTGSGAEGQVAMRGFGDNSGLRALILVDGQVYNPPDMGGINWLGIDLSDLEMVEVIRGGQTVLYGNHAVSGVIKLKTRQPGEQLEGSVHFETGSDRLYRAGASLGQDLGSLAIKGGINRIESDGYRERSTMDSLSGYIAVSGEMGESFKWNSRLRMDEGNMQFPGPVPFEVMLEDPRKSILEGEDFAENQEIQWTIGMEAMAGDNDWQGLGAFLERTRSWELQGVYAENVLSRFSLSPRLRHKLEEGFIIVGFDGIADELDFFDYLRSERDILRAKARIERLSAGAYVFASHEIRDGLTLSGGFRKELMESDTEYTHFKESQLLPEIETNRGNIPNPEYKNPADVDYGLSYSGPVDKNGWAAELSLVKELQNGLRLWTGWDRVYRYPALDETASYQGYPLSDPLNSSLEPETGNNLELGIKLQEDSWDLSLTAFHLALKDEISYDDSARLNVNIGDTERTGVELFFSYRENAYGIDLNASWVDASFADTAGRKHVPLVPDLEAGLTVWAIPIQSFRIQANLQWLDHQFQGNDFVGAFRKIPSSTLLHLSMYWEVSEALGVSLSINNVLDEVYAVSAYSGGFYPGAGRRGILRVKYKF
ncbi:MAG: TonB-dependent receptor [Puniceicoccaceae bacterium]